MAAKESAAAAAFKAAFESLVQEALHTSTNISTGSSSPTAASPSLLVARLPAGARKHLSRRQWRMHAAGSIDITCSESTENTGTSAGASASGGAGGRSAVVRGPFGVASFRREGDTQRNESTLLTLCRPGDGEGGSLEIEHALRRLGSSHAGRKLRGTAEVAAIARSPAGSAMGLGRPPTVLAVRSAASRAAFMETVRRSGTSPSTRRRADGTWNLSLQYGGGGRLHVGMDGSVEWVPRAAADPLGLARTNALREHVMRERRR